MAVHLTPAEAARLGITPKVKKRTTSKAVAGKDCGPTQCHACDEVFTTEAGASRHNTTTGHGRYDCVLG